MAVMVGVIGGLLPLWIRGYNMVSTGDAEDDDEGVMTFDLREHEPKVGGYDQLNNNKHLSFMYS